jgi:hypothetical protein
MDSELKWRIIIQEAEHKGYKGHLRFLPRIMHGRNCSDAELEELVIKCLFHHAATIMRDNEFYQAIIPEPIVTPTSYIDWKEFKNNTLSAPNPLEYLWENIDV